MIERVVELTAKRERSGRWAVALPEEVGGGLIRVYSLRDVMTLVRILELHGHRVMVEVVREVYHG